MPQTSQSTELDWPSAELYTASTHSPSMAAGSTAVPETSVCRASNEPLKGYHETTTNSTEIRKWAIYLLTS